MTLLTICQDAVNEIGDFEVPSTIVNNTNQTAVQLLALAKREIRTLARRHDWSDLVTVHTFATVADTQSYSLPSDFGWIISESVWDRTNDWKVRGPLTPSQWEQAQATDIASAAWLWWRIFGGSMYLYPTPSAVATIAYEYVSSNLTSAGNTWTADSDTFLLDEELATLGVRWRYLKAKGFPYEEEFNEYEMEVKKAIARDGGSTGLNLDGRSAFTPENPAMTEGNWNVS